MNQTADIFILVLLLKVDAGDVVDGYDVVALVGDTVAPLFDGQDSGLIEELIRG